MKKSKEGKERGKEEDIHIRILFLLDAFREHATRLLHTVTRISSSSSIRASSQQRMHVAQGLKLLQFSKSEGKKKTLHSDM